MTTADASHSPPGTESVWAYTHLPHRAHWAAADIAAHVERMEAVLEAHAPGFAQLVVGRNVFSPADLEREDPSLVGGAVGGGTAAAFQQLFLRPIPGLGRADTPVDRLYLASASAHPGGGVHGAPGANAARAAMARDRALTGGVYRSVIDAANRAIYR
jgi:phytoene dehydrogenase-like protein